ncbi:hypothetical protein OE88DRAFT_644649 [Heliocybe sulcata]|uniref:Uncharacterized protein n=1 Tax=Heliocybe sulcata TaxID=5364 RepID=A0A5C3ND64_9AGAM|nr:hypothetical protein OE88DRAFT_644649 [Heliocybe sulcata]
MPRNLASGCMTSHATARFYCLILYVLFLSLQIPHISCSQNYTIDDQYGDPINELYPVYSPAGAKWAGAPECNTCSADVDATQAYDGTWHDATYYIADKEPAVVRIPFHGTAIYAYCIIGNSLNYTTATYLTFRLDNETVGAYNHRPNASAPEFQYDIPVYVNESILNGAHYLEIINSVSSYNASLILFDYATYTYEGNSTTSTASPSLPSPSTSQHSAAATSESTNSAAVVGGVLGTLLFLGLAAGAVAIFRYRRQRSRALSAIWRIPPRPRPATVLNDGQFTLSDMGSNHWKSTD